MENSFADNLDDGELWLPSDIFPLEEHVPVLSNTKLIKNNHPMNITCSLCYSYSCLQHHQAHNTQSVTKPFPITESRFRPAERCCSCTDCSLLECFERSRSGGKELLRTGPPPVYPYQLYPPPVQLQHQVESLREARTRFLQMQEKKNRFIRMHNLGIDRFASNRFLPFVGGGGGGGGGFNGESSSVRDYGGTGVFLPRVPINIDNNGGQKQGGRNRQSVQQNGQRYPPCI